MATFEEQVEALTSLAISGSSTPTQDELSQFLKDGVVDITNKWLSVRPQDRSIFVLKSGTQASQGYNTEGAEIVTVLREAGADGDADDSTAWRKCREVNEKFRSDVLDSGSIHYATKEDPVYLIHENGKVNVYPVPDGSDDGYDVYFVNNSPQNASGVALAYSHSDLKYFPKSKIYLVAIYAAIRSIEAKLASYTVDDEDIELVQALQATLATLKDDYMKGFNIGGG